MQNFLRNLSRGSAKKLMAARQMGTMVHLVV
uniref:ATARP5 n=1 Tax=Arundo donax TaxID=35708 RepID=A0A0A9E8P7_ARUDO